MAEEDNDTDAVVEKKGGIGKTLIIAVVALVLVGGGVFAGVVFLGGDEPTEEELAAAELEAELEAEAEAGPPTGPALYASLHPPLVVNFKDNVGDSHFMQITMDVMAREQTTINAVREHTPVIRNALILLYSAAVYEEVTTLDGKKKMLADGLAEIQAVMTDQIGEPGVEAVYFTALVIQ